MTDPPSPRAPEVTPALQTRADDRLRSLCEREGIAAPPVRVLAYVGRSPGRCGLGSQIAESSPQSGRINISAAAVRDLSDAGLDWTLTHELGHVAYHRTPRARLYHWCWTAVMLSPVVLATATAVAGVILDLLGLPSQWAWPTTLALLLTALVLLLGLMASRRREETRADLYAANLLRAAAGAHEATGYYLAHMAPVKQPRTALGRMVKAALASHPTPARRLQTVEEYLAG